MSDIKSVVSLLSKIINNYFEINIRAEHFRLAKYNKEDENIVQLFWHLLNNCCDIKHTDNLVTNIKLHFACLGYKNIEFYCLPEDMSTGSRELLLALSWLIQKEKILDNALSKELEQSDLNINFDLNFFGHHSREGIPNLNSIEDIYNYILWISGRINNNLKQISELKTRTLLLTNKVHKDTFFNRKSCHLSINETILLKNHDSLKNYLLKIEKTTHMLDYYRRWRLKESFYWEWMLTVIKEKEKDMVSLHTDALESFFIDLRKYAKSILVKNDTLLNTQKNLNASDKQLPRYIYAPKHDSILNPQEEIKNNLTSQHDKNLNEITEFLELYCNKPSTR